jgi:predicted nucleotidyltransferase
VDTTLPLRFVLRIRLRKKIPYFYIMSELVPILKNKKNDVVNLCRSLQVKRMYAFGSAVSGHFHKDSDLDFLISFDENLSVAEYTQNFFSLHDQLRKLLNRDIDIVTESSLSNPYFIASINESKVLLYEA